VRSRKRILGNLETLYQDAFTQASEAERSDRMSELDFEYQRDQLWFELLLDLREVLQSDEPADDGPSLLDKAKQIRDLTRLR